MTVQAASVASRWQRLSVALVIALLLGVNPLGFTQDSLDLRSVLVAAQASNLELRAARQLRALAVAGLTTARQRPNPVIGFSGARDTPHETLTLDLPIELGGKRSRRIAVANEEQKSTEVDLTVLGRHIRRRTREAFFLSLAARAQTAHAQTTLDLSRRIRELVQQRYEAGSVAQLEVVQADVEYARSNADYETAVQAQRAADIALAALLNRRIDVPLNISGRIEDMPAAPTLEMVTSQALQSSADLLRTSQELKTEETRVELAKAMRVPNLEVTAGADFNSPPDFHAGGRGGLAVTVPLFYHGQGEVALSGARLNLLRLTLASQQNIVSAEVASSYFDFIAKAQQAREFRDNIVPQTVRLEEMAEDSYRAGKTNVLTLLDAQRRLNDVQRAYIGALLAAQTSFAVLEESVGVSLD